MKLYVTNFGGKIEALVGPIVTVPEAQKQKEKR